MGSFIGVVRKGFTRTLRPEGGREAAIMDTGEKYSMKGTVV